MRAVIADGFEMGARVYFTISIARRAGHACGSSCDSGFMVRTDRSGTSAAEFASGLPAPASQPRPGQAACGTPGDCWDPGDGRQGSWGWPSGEGRQQARDASQRARTLRVECWPL